MKKYPLVLAVVMFCLFRALPAHAETLADFNGQLAKYQAAPFERAQELRLEINRMREREEGFARQYGFTVSEILSYEMLLEHTVNCYMSIHFLQQQGAITANPFLLDDKNVNEILATQPPYSMLFYLDFIEDVENCRNQLNSHNQFLERAKSALYSSNLTKAAMERKYRLWNEKISSDEENALKLNWEMRQIKASLEQANARHTYFRSASEIARIEAEDVQEKLKILTPMLDKIRKNIVFSAEDFIFLTGQVDAQTSRLSKTVKALEIQYRSLAELQKSHEGRTPFMSYWIATEQRLSRDEILLLYDVIEGWASLRKTWSSIQDLLEGKLDTTQQKNALADVTSSINEIERMLNKSIEQIQKIREVEQELVRRYDTERTEMRPEEIARRDEFISKLELRKNRYLACIASLGIIESQYKDLQNEIKLILKEHDAETKIHNIWYENVTGVMDRELWHVGEYPITVAKVLRALLVLLIGLALTMLLSRLAKRYSAMKDMNKHNQLLVQRIVFYIGVVFTMLATLWSLNVPMTAFAFLGGTAMIALGFGLQKIMADFFSGIILLFQRKIRVGDVVIANDKCGVVTEITLQSTVILYEESKNLIIPNSKVLDGTLVNLTLNNSVNRTDVSVSIAYGGDTIKATGAMRRILSEDPGVLKSPAFKILCNDLGSSSIKITARFFYSVKNNFEYDLQSRIRYKILEAFKEEKIEIPFPQTDVHIK